MDFEQNSAFIIAGIILILFGILEIVIAKLKRNEKNKIWNNFYDFLAKWTNIWKLDESKLRAFILFHGIMTLIFGVFTLMALYMGWFTFD